MSLPWTITGNRTASRLCCSTLGAIGSCHCPPPLVPVHLLRFPDSDCGLDLAKLIAAENYLSRILQLASPIPDAVLSTTSQSSAWEGYTAQNSWKSPPRNEVDCSPSEYVWGEDGECGDLLRAPSIVRLSFSSNFEWQMQKEGSYSP